MRRSWCFLRGSSSSTGRDDIHLGRYLALFSGVLLTIAGFGLIGSLLSLTLASRGLEAWVGPLGAAYFVGLGLGSLRGERTIARVGYHRAYGVLTASACLGVLAVFLFEAPWVWMVARLAQGFALGGLFVCIESWLGSTAEPETRGRVLAIYQIVAYVGLMAGQVLMGQFATAFAWAVVLSAALICAAAIPVGLSRQTAPDITVQPRFRLVELYKLAGLGLIGAAVSGMTTGAVYTVAPAAGVLAGLTEAEVGWMMVSFIAGGLVLQVPVGRASDGLDRRWVLAGVGGLGAVGALLCAAVVGSPGALMAVSAFEGGWVFAIYVVALAYLYDRVPQERVLSANAGMLLVFCVGSGVGSVTSSMLLNLWGPVGFYVALFVPCAVLGGVATRYALTIEALDADDRGDVVFVPRTSLAVVELDPRVDMEVLEAHSDSGADPE